MLFGDDILPLLVLAVGGALAVGTALALVRPRQDEDGDELPRPPAGRSAIMIALGTLAALWAVASMISG